MITSSIRLGGFGNRLLISSSFPLGRRPPLSGVAPRVSRSVWLCTPASRRIRQTSVYGDVLDPFIRLPFFFHPVKLTLSIGPFRKLITVPIPFPFSKLHAFAMRPQVIHTAVVLKGLSLLPSGCVASDLPLLFRLERAVDHALGHAVKD